MLPGTSGRSAEVSSTTAEEKEGEEGKKGKVDGERQMVVVVLADRQKKRHDEKREAEKCKDDGVPLDKAMEGMKKEEEARVRRVRPTEAKGIEDEEEVVIGVGMGRHATTPGKPMRLAREVKRKRDSIFY